MSTARLANRDDLAPLLALFAASEVSPAASGEAARTIWDEMIDHPGVATLVVEGNGAMLATATLVHAPNLLRGGRRHGFLENVVTHPDHRRQGHGERAVRAALDHAWATGCHHVLMQSGRADPAVHRFYERLGFVPGLRTAYVAARPDAP